MFYRQTEFQIYIIFIKLFQLISYKDIFGISINVSVKMVYEDVFTLL